MNPSQQVVTPGGYAVDVESEEGRAVLAARVELDSIGSALQPSAGGVEVPSPAARERAEGEGDDMQKQTSQTSDQSALDVSAESTDVSPAMALIPTLSRAAGEGEKQHIRYGKRVGDFSASTHHVQPPEPSQPDPLPILVEPLSVKPV